MQNKEQIYKMIFYGKLSDAARALLEDPILSPCLLSLVYVLQNQTQQAEEVLKTVIQGELDLIDLLAYEESGMILALKNTGYSIALLKAQQIIVVYPKASFANYFLARDARKQRKWGKAFEHYEKLAAIYPDNDSLLLDVAEVMVFLKKSAAALGYVNRAKHSVRQRLYKILIPIFGTIFSRLAIFLAIFGLLLVVGTNSYVNIGFVLLTSIGFLGSVQKDFLISSSFLYLGIAWLLSLWIRSLM